MDVNLSNLPQFKIVSALDQLMVIDCVMDQNNSLALWKWHSGDNQRWNIQDLGNGKYMIYNIMNSKVISAPIDLDKDGMFIKCRVSKKLDQQCWEMVSVLDHEFKQRNAFYIMNPITEKVLDVNEGKAKNGQAIIEWGMKTNQKLKAKLNQIWLIEPVSFIFEKNSFYKIFSSLDYSLVLDASKCQANLHSVILYHCHKGANQKFHFETVKGKYMLINKDGDLALTVDSQQEGTKVEVAVSKKQHNQLWELIPCKQKEFSSKNAYYIKSAYGMYLDTIHEKGKCNEEVVQRQFTGNQSQVWFVHKI